MQVLLLCILNHSCSFTHGSVAPIRQHVSMIHQLRYQPSMAHYMLIRGATVAIVAHRVCMSCPTATSLHLRKMYLLWETSLEQSMWPSTHLTNSRIVWRCSEQGLKKSTPTHTNICKSVTLDKTTDYSTNSVV